MSSDDAVNTIIQALKEAEELPRKQIAEIVEVLGPETALGLLAETQRVQGEGGIAVRDGTRRRTDGGVFFSLAKTKLPKADRNRIFRVRPPKSPDAPGSEREPGQEDVPIERAEAPARAAPPPAPVPRSRDVGAAPRAAEANGGSGRRRVVEVEVLRHHPKPIAPPAPEPRRPVAPVDTGVREAAAPVAGLRPLRRIVTVAPAVREAPPATPEAATGRIKEVLQGLSVGEQRRVLIEILREIGGLPQSEPKRAPPPPAPPPPPPPPEDGVDEKTRERVLAAVTDALGLSTSDLARVLFGEETAGTRARARNVLERFRRS